MLNRFLFRWLVLTAAILLVSHILPGVRFDSAPALLAAALLLGILNSLVRPVLFVLTLPFTIVTLGLFIFVLNGFLLWLAGALIRGFEVSSLLSAILASVLISIVSAVMNHLAAQPAGR